jgi:ATP-dependent helicase HepA
MKTTYHPGQRFISDSEPELGLGSVTGVTRLTVAVAFRAIGEKREYARDNAPLRRVRFHAGDRVRDREGTTLAITSVGERRGLLYYQGEGRELCETDLFDALTFDKPEDRLFMGQVDTPSVFELRADALRHQHRRRQSEVRGFVGGRIDLIPHQLYIASETAGRLLPRVLLADEVGLGKTIEACLIIHRLILTGRASRVLIVAPDSLVHQWLVEVLRRFNIWFHIFDEARCVSIETAREGANPFLDDQYVLASLRLFTDNPKRVDQAREAGWDILVVDEAHHLGWTAESTSPEYEAVEALSRGAPGLLLLTATPEQVGIASHFARLRLLDPARFSDLDAFKREVESYRTVAKEAEQVADPGALKDLLDRHGTSRVMFRNSRARIQGFPGRSVELVSLEGKEDDQFSGDPRLDWLVGWLKEGHEKLLLIGRSREKAEAIEAALRPRLKVKAAVFHEGLSLVQRDRHAAWFAEEDGARLLICSEIGSEGRNFQFARHLALFDLPGEPELLEQRIGRLDRIGQRSEIRVHVPFIAGTASEVLARWYHDGLDAFRRNLPGGHELRERFQGRLDDLSRSFPNLTRAAREESLSALVHDARKAREEVSERLEHGRDRLLELNSFRPAAAASLVDRIRMNDSDTSLDAFMIAVFDQFAIPVEEIAPRTYQLGSAGVLADVFPGLPPTGLALTCDRARALAREDIQFLTWDHPMVTAALDLLLGSERGNSSFAFWPDPGSKGLYLETLFVVECVAPKALHADRFLAPTPIRVVLDHRGDDCTGEIPSDRLRRLLKPGDPALLQKDELRDVLSVLLRKAREFAQDRVPPLVTAARGAMTTQLDHEAGRLRGLREVNPSVRAEEIDLLVAQKADLDSCLSRARLRLDAIRVLMRGPS